MVAGTADMEEIKRMFAQINTKVTTVEEKLGKNAETLGELKQENQRLIKTVKDQEERLQSVGSTQRNWSRNQSGGEYKGNHETGNFQTKQEKANPGQATNVKQEYLKGPKN
ncbi:hypothetical protein FQA39_LY08506 [Lamprigera yunnana]|nr:hypothetical protein FQA39_LY08506 [Lamprigera yunnana]